MPVECHDDHMTETQGQPPQQYAAPQQGAQQSTTQTAPKGLAISALIVGIVGFLMGLLPVVGAIIGVAAVVLGVIALVKAQPKGLAVTGLVLGACAIIASVGMTAGLGALTSEVVKNQPTTTTPGEEQSVQIPEDDEEAAAPAEPEAPATQDRLTLKDGWKVSTDEYGVYKVVKGYVLNNSDEAITTYVQITFDTLDKNGANLGTCLANTNTIDANGKWKFEAACLDDAAEIDKVRFKEITGF